MAAKIYITGSGGIVGRHALKVLAELAPGAEVIRNTADLTNLSETAAAIAAAGPLDLVIHLAAMVPVAAVNADPARAYAVNAGGTINLLSALSASPARMLLCSTSHVYASQDTPIPESAVTKPVTVYGQSKLMAEQAALEICAVSGRSLCIGRLFSIHDPEQTGSYLRPSLEKRFTEADPEADFELYGADGLRDFLTARAAARYLVRLALSDAEGVVNVASGNPVTVAGFAQSLAPFPLKITPMGQSNNLVADVSRLQHILGECNA
ncbi:NAD-dependent epimerase/dehydratase family protein [Leisingera daeponensis]|uniref:NAD-dependent epimerase/dehydratase family protein n=1 Tax=Leisingera daeponensis TaxID=405746 RepID=UPI001C972B67|nr:SDR family oxidoreductase [Leisingera daeponensis]MBY6058709.1 SDR family oxidoreductase [Leisingera daeponensis]